MAEDSRVGRLLGDRYRVDELIGRGGMATVYRGFDIQLHRPVAIKIFQHGEDGDDLRWESEVRLLSQLNHPHLVTVHDAHLEPTSGDGVSYLVMEYVSGSNLQQHLTAQGPSASLAALVIAQIGEALGSVHARGIIHRDLKPGNILIERSELPPLFLRSKLADFGIAHLLGSDRVTRTGTMIGTAAYTSPEQVNGESATSASDVYSLGLVAIECLSGRAAFPGTASESLIARLTRDPVLPVGLPTEWTALLSAMTARDPALRPSALEAALRSGEFASQTVGPVPLDVTPATEAMAIELGQTDAIARTERMLPPTLLLPVASTTPSSGAEGATHSRRRVVLAVAIVAGALILAAVAFSHLPTGSASPTGGTPSSGSTTPTSTPTLASTSPSPTIQAPGNGHGHGNGNGKKGNG
ncbi:MAG: serine/threonine protein kinase [Actinomycetota bacterium]|nr:serine/threonine protein kinase [Actinomycetota bacterium]